MIKRLRRKFIIVTLISVTLVLGLVVALVNVLNYRITEKELDLKMSVLLSVEQRLSDEENANNSDREGAENSSGEDENSGSYEESESGNAAGGGTGNSSQEESENAAGGETNSSPKDAGENGMGEGSSSRPQPPDNSNNPDNSDNGPGEFRDFRKDIILDSGEEDNYFTVEFLYGAVAGANCMHAKDIDEETAKSMAEELYKDSKDYGYTGDWKYAVFYEDETSDELTYIFLNAESKRSSFFNILILSIVLLIGAEILVLLLVASLSKIVTKPIAESYDKQRRFITDASHELKTPIAIIEANTEVMEITSGETEWTESNKRQVNRLSELIEKMVFLSRMDEENAQYLNMIDFDLSEALEEVADGFKGIAESSGRSLDLNIEKGIVYNGDEGTIRQMVSLLLDNAFKYASEGGCVSLSVSTREQGKNKILIEQTNPVDDIQKGDLDMLFERFYRTDESRNSEKGGQGIGLSVVRAIVQAHKGKIHAESRDGKSIKFSIQL